MTIPNVIPGTKNASVLKKILRLLELFSSGEQDGEFLMIISQQVCCNYYKCMSQQTFYLPVDRIDTATLSTSQQNILNKPCFIPSICALLYLSRD